MWVPGAYTINFCYFIQHEAPNDALQNYFIYFWYLKVKVCTKWCLCGSVVPGAPGHEHIRKPLHQRSMAFQTVIRTETRG